MSESKNPTIEEKIQQLEAAVAWFDSDEFEVERALEKYESTQKLADSIQKELAELKNTITRIDSETK